MQNRLVQTSGPAASFKYDPLGRLVEYTPPIPGLTTQFLYDGDALVGEYTISGGVPTQTKRYVHGDQVDEPWVQYDVSLANSRYFLHSDHQGSVIARTNNSGNVALRLSYDNYGVAQTANTDRFGFTGQTWLREVGLNYYKARMYSPKLGIFLQTDPVGFADGMNSYSYVAGDPINNVDPSGKDTVECVASDLSGEANVVCQTIVVEASESTHMVIRSPLKAFGDFTGWQATSYDFPGTLNNQDTLNQVDHQLSITCGCDANLAKAEENNYGGAITAIAMMATLYEGHHPWPKYLGGPFKQKLTRLPENLHREFHRGLDLIMDRRRGKSFFDALSPRARREMYRDLGNYTKEFDAKFGTSLYKDLLKNGFPKL